jgi:hypothetical protein
MLKRIADALDVEVVDLFTFPGERVRHDLIDATRGMSATTMRYLLAEAETSNKR